MGIYSSGSSKVGADRRVAKAAEQGGCGAFFGMPELHEDDDESSLGREVSAVEGAGGGAAEDESGGL